jgi:hypothetical protein
MPLAVNYVNGLILCSKQLTTVRAGFDRYFVIEAHKAFVAKPAPTY